VRTASCGSSDFGKAAASDRLADFLGKVSPDGRDRWRLPFCRGLAGCRVCLSWNKREKGPRTLPDDENETGGQNPQQPINSSDSYEVRYWAGKFGVTPAKLLDAVRTVGTGADDVEAYLKTARG
jgi:hypothetical protein